MKGDAICQRSFKETMPKRDSLRMNAFCARLPICTIKTAIHRKTSPIWSLVPGRPSVKPCRKPESEVLSVFLSRSEEHTSELQSHLNLVCRLLLEKKKQPPTTHTRRSWSTRPQRALR